jgi:hypothetical protein
MSEAAAINIRRLRDRRRFAENRTGTIFGRGRFAGGGLA